MKKWILVLGTLLSASAARADVVCKVQTQMGPATVTIGNNAVTIAGAALEKPVVYSPIDAEWDGHATELITAKGLSISYQDWYGCIHNARITANFRDGGTRFIESVEVGQCSGGSTPDHICHVPN